MPSSYSIRKRSNHPDHAPRARRARSVLLTEGSSLTAREVVTCLGPLGYRLEVLDPDPLCLARFSRWVAGAHRCPHGAARPLEYVRFLERTVRERAIDAVLPTHEQAWLLAAALPRAGVGLPLALADPGAFERVQSKLAFARLLDELGMPQPPWRTLEREEEIARLQLPCWLKAPYSTAGRGVREVRDASAARAAFRELRPGGGPLLAQQPARGSYGQVQGLFARGELVAAHCSVQRATGMGGSAAARESVEHPAARAHLRRLGAALGWHGGITLDYMYERGEPLFIECNPRTVEPGNAAASGVNIPDLQVRLTLGEALAPAPAARAGVRTHGTIAVLMGLAASGASRARVLAELRDAGRGRGRYASSAEQLTPLRRDPPSALPLAFVAARLLAAPGQAASLAAAAVGRYSIGPQAVAVVAASRA